VHDLSEGSEVCVQLQYEILFRGVSEGGLGEEQTPEIPLKERVYLLIFM